MTENFKNFLEAVSKDEALAAKLGQEADVNVIRQVAGELGFTLTEADFAKADVEELSDDELEAAVGGQSVSCSCAVGGGGAKDENDKTCACVAVGFGYSKNGKERCFCPLAGYGYDY